MGDSTSQKQGASKKGDALIEIRTDLAKILTAITRGDQSAAIAALQAQMTRMETVLLELRDDVPRFSAQIPKSMSPEEVAALLSEKPGARLIALNHHKHSGLKPGDAFEPRQKFRTPQHMISLIRGGHLIVSQAAA